MFNFSDTEIFLLLLLVLLLAPFAFVCNKFRKKAKRQEKEWKASREKRKESDGL